MLSNVSETRTKAREALLDLLKPHLFVPVKIDPPRGRSARLTWLKTLFRDALCQYDPEATVDPLMDRFRVRLAVVWQWDCKYNEGKLAHQVIQAVPTPIVKYDVAV